MKTREIFSATNGQKVPVTVDLNVETLMYDGKPVTNGYGQQIMNDCWIYVYMKGYGNCAINVNRSQYCEKVYLSNMTILESIQNGKTTKRLADFIKTVSDKLVFEKDGITYRVYLTKTKTGYDLSHVKCYWLITHSPNLYFENIPTRYKSVVYLPEKSYSKWAHELLVDLKKAFNFK